MAMQVIWTALPNGISGGKLRLSVFVSPRLTGRAQSTTLSEFTPFLNWPDSLAKIQLAMRYGATTVQPSSRSARAVGDIWTALFHPSTLVTSYNWTDQQNRKVNSYDVKNTAELIKGRYAKIGKENPTTPPTVQQLVTKENLGLVGFYGGLNPTPGEPNPQAKYFGLIDQQVKVNGFLPRIQLRAAGGAENPEAVKVNFAAVKRFYLRPHLMQIAGQAVPKAPPKPVPPVLDFHQMLSSLGTYPDIMRRAGVVIDLEFTLPAGTPAADRVQVVVTGDRPLGIDSKTPPTMITAATFLPAPSPKESDIRNGMMTLGDPRFELVMFDVDGAALNLIDFSTNLQRRMERYMDSATADSLAQLPEDHPMWAVCARPGQQRSGALQAVTPVGQKALLMSVAAKEPAERETLPALRSAGIAVVKSERGRLVKEKLQRSSKLQSAFVAPVAQVRAAPGDDVLWADDLSRGYAIDVWDSVTQKWNSTVQRIGSYEFLDVPGKTVADVRDEGFVQPVGASDPATKELYQHECIFRWVGWSLAVERPGKSIVADDQLENVEANKAKNTARSGLRMIATYKVPPGTLPRLRYGVGYKLRARVVDLAGNTVGFNSDFANNPAVATKQVTYQRYSPVAVPAVTLCAKPRPTEQALRLVIRSRNEGGPLEPDSQRYIAAPPTAEMTAEEHGKFDGAANMLRDKSNNDTYGVITGNDRTLKDLVPGAKQGDMVLFPPGTLTDLPYLPDPMAQGALLQNLPSGAARISTKVGFDPAPNWFDAKPFRVRLIEGSGAPQWDAAVRVLTVMLPKGEKIEDVLLSSAPDPAGMAAMGVVQWMSETGAPPQVLQLTRTGQHWMVTPHEKLALVHAVQQPIEAPRLGRLVPVRLKGNTYAVLTDTGISVHGKSTARLDFKATWNEWIDNLVEDEPRQVPGQANACDLQVMYDQTRVVLTAADNYRHEFHDNKYRRVTYSAVGTTRYRNEFSDLGLKDEDFQKSSTPVTVDVPNSARPDAPQVLYVIPVFKWDKQKQGGRISRKRSGGGLRIYLDRPWYSSGDGEKLAVVLQLSTATRAKVEPYITLWGKDPIWRSNPARNAELNTADFPLKSTVRGMDFGKLGVQTLTPAGAATAVQATKPGVTLNPVLVPFINAGYTLEELGNATDATVDIAPHDVQFDKKRKLWYCDVEIKMPEAYMPFVRLALARFQPNSVPNCHLSRVTRVDYIQLTPERSITVAQNPRGTAQQLDVTFTGVSYDVDASGSPGPAIVRVIIEQRKPDGSGSFGWAPALGEAVELRRSKSGAQAVYSGLVTLPGARENYRLVVQEFEQLYGGDDPLRPTVEPRLVFADAIEL